MEFPSNMSYENMVALSQRIYRGETVVADLSGTPFKGFGQMEWIRYFIDRFGGYDGSHHKDWVLDQVMRISFGTEVIVSLAVWDGEGYYDEHWRVSTDEPSQEYLDYVESCEDYECGVAP